MWGGEKPSNLTISGSKVLEGKISTTLGHSQEPDLSSAQGKEVAPQSVLWDRLSEPVHVREGQRKFWSPWAGRKTEVHSNLTQLKQRILCEPWLLGVTPSPDICPIPSTEILQEGKEAHRKSKSCWMIGTLQDLTSRYVGLRVAVTLPSSSHTGTH
jgi:hypothetical protein